MNAGVIRGRIHARLSGSRKPAGGAPKEFLTGSACKVLTYDGYSGYNIIQPQIIMDEPRIIQRCNIHARRYFADIMKSKKDCGPSRPDSCACRRGL
ncbi:IS66 family transposase [Pseudogemmobacter bohemicus]|uniref:IS66 family transposase n=1 Tax=Pseudogemmobacter bohemicus TaxID=2250708 RepID=UPI0013003685